jgi:hypothetical protein
MPLAKIHVHEGRYDEARLIKLGNAIQAASEETLRMYRERTISASTTCCLRPVRSYAWFPGLTYTDDLILLEITFIAGRSRDARLTLLRAINERVVSAVGEPVPEICTGR